MSDELVRASRRSLRPAFVGVERPVVVGSWAVVDLRVALAGVKLELPAHAVLHSCELVPGEVFRLAAVDTPDIDEHHGVEVQLPQDVSAPVTSPHARRRKSAATVAAGDRRACLYEVDQDLQADRLVAGMLDHRHLLGKVLGADAVGRVRGVCETALGPDPVYSSTGIADRSGGSSFHTRFSSEVSATSGAGIGVRPITGSPDSEDRFDELPQPANPRHSPQIKAASIAADLHGARL